MLSVVYVSSAVIPFTELQLRELLTVSRDNNVATQVTGMLLYSGGNFMQVLEGEDSAVKAVHERISLDKRHCGMVTLLQEQIFTRQFGEWSMGFRNLTSPEVQSALGFSDILNFDLTGAEFRENPSLAQKLLLSFKKNR